MSDHDDHDLPADLADAYLAADRGEAGDAELARLQTHVADSFATPPTDAEVASAAVHAKRLVHNRLQARSSSDVVGRIGFAGESDASSTAWRVIRWPLAAAASLVAGLVLVTFLTSDQSESGRLAGNPQQPTQQTNVQNAPERQDVESLFTSATDDWSAAVAYLDADAIFADTPGEAWPIDDSFDIGS